MFVSLVILKTKNILRTCKNIWSASPILCISVEHGTPRSLIIMSLSKKKELLVLGATAVSCAAAAAAAGYSYFNKENQPDQPNKKLIETAKETILEKVHDRRSPVEVRIDLRKSFFAKTLLV